MDKQAALRFEPAALRKALDQRGWTAYRLADEIGVDRAFAYRVVKGQAAPGRKFLLGLQQAGIDIAEVTVLDAG